MGLGERTAGQREGRRNGSKRCISKGYSVPGTEPRGPQDMDTEDEDEQEADRLIEVTYKRRVIQS